ncbi:peptide chain release factor N(5)-glutamine methyltransferase [Mycoplasmopsis cynos]|uniref:peptide chain release factor N(5)-glutamine methyltransferase n=2 Tax=Mycoplasmopsis cynos TaxID=171284 RepID=UPI002AFE23D6|nr:peptide chain release factor N(5)-glutamine methyltransferase [Mycoplasmopsis cynos]WQQ19045.1 peptide chain release factor N(5)-glutamine methyltransferase [Mycoplasmopsis cynos]
MPEIKDLLLEKRRYGLKETITLNEIKLLKNHVPVQKIIGYIEMQDVIIDVSKNVLIPRYETEELIIKILSDHPKSKNLKVLDLCAGSGFIGLALKKHRPNWDVFLVDISPEAIEECNINAKKNNLDVTIIQSDLFQELNNIKFDLIVSNPPYLDQNEPIAKSVLLYEPYIALFAENNGRYFYQRILADAQEYLNENGIIYFEINPLHLEWWNQQKTMYNIEIFKDINQRDRILKMSYKKH